MLALIKILLGCCLIWIFIQDIKERKVYLFLFVACGIMMTYLFYSQSQASIYLWQIGFNLMVVGIITLILFLYAKWVLVKSFYKTLGLGDLSFFLAIAIGFSTGNFLILFSFSLLFSGILYMMMKSKMKITTVPLAGYQALFFCLVYGSNWIFSFTNLYSF